MQEPHERLQYARKLAGHDSASEAADALGTPRPTYMAHENGSRGFKAEAARYAQFFRVSFEWLVTGRGEARPTSLDARVKAMSPDQQRRVYEYIDLIEGSASARKVS